MKYTVSLKVKLKSGASQQDIIKRLKEIHFMDYYLYDSLQEVIMAILMGYNPETKFENYTVPTDGEIYSLYMNSFEQDEKYNLMLRDFFDEMIPYLDKYSYIDIKRYLPDGIIASEMIGLTAEK